MTESGCKYSVGNRLVVLNGEHAGVSVEVVGLPKATDNTYRCRIKSGVDEGNYVSVGEELLELPEDAQTQKAS
ncbi:MAG: hypothetical protein HUU49_01050 [Candidatus Buchananbacteria bacterium]|nr:hypothetical protein [Candidatus Buchananbacteria bacterium]